MSKILNDLMDNIAMKKKHTPTPYDFFPQNDRLKRYSIICINDKYCPGAGKEIIAVNIRRKETAAFISRACNWHDDLVAALECAQALDIPYGEGVKILEKHGYNRSTLTASCFVQDKIAAALTKARII